MNSPISTETPSTETPSTETPSAETPRTRSLKLAVFALLGCGALAAAVMVLGDKPPRTPATRPVATSNVPLRLSSSSSLPSSPPSPSSPSSSPRARETRALPELTPLLDDEPALLDELRGMWRSEPDLALHLARLARPRYPQGALAAEREWIIIRSLTSLGRHQEAQDEARQMVAQFAGTTWASDVERHVLVHPVGHPSREEIQARMERGDWPNAGK